MKCPNPRCREGTIYHEEIAKGLWVMSTCLDCSGGVSSCCQPQSDPLHREELDDVEQEDPLDHVRDVVGGD